MSDTTTAEPTTETTDVDAPAKPLTPAELIKKLIDAGIHFGHPASRWNPKMKPYIHGKRGNIHIIDVKETLKGLIRASASSRTPPPKAKRCSSSAPSGRHATSSPSMSSGVACTTSASVGSAAR